jgi:hypothetical protein
LEKSKTGLKVEESWVENSTAVDTLRAEVGRGFCRCAGFEVHAVAREADSARVTANARWYLILCELLMPMG